MHIIHYSKGKMCTNVHFLEEASFISKMYKYIFEEKLYRKSFTEDVSFLSVIKVSKLTFFDTPVNKRQSSQKLDKECTINNILNIFNKYFVK